MHLKDFARDTPALSGKKARGSLPACFRMLCHKKRKVATSGGTEKKAKGQQRRGGGDRWHMPATGNGPAGHETQKAPSGPKRSDVAPKRRGLSAGPRRRLHNTTAGHGSAVRSRVARPRWVIMEISRSRDHGDLVKGFRKSPFSVRSHHTPSANFAYLDIDDQHFRYQVNFEKSTPTVAASLSLIL